MIITVLLVIAGFTALIFGANWLVEGASALAKRCNVSDFVIGLTIVAFGTSAPELVVNTTASMQGYSDIVLGNIIGSNNFNLFIILGLTGLIVPIQVQRSTVWKEIPISLLVSVLVLLLLNDFDFSSPSYSSRVDGWLMLGLFFLFLYYVFFHLKQTAPPVSVQSMPILKIWFLIIIGLIGLVVGGHLVVENSIKIAHDLGVSEKIIGLTIVAAGTSLPELVTSVVAATKKNRGIAIGNVIGSNIFNFLLILSISSLAHPISYNPKFNTDLYIFIGGTVFLWIAMFIGKQKKLDRWEAALLFLFYIAYTTYLTLQEV